MQMAGKNNRILDLYDRLMNGETISKQEYADRYGVNEKSVQRDLRDIRNFFAMKLAEEGYGQVLIYDRKEQGYRLIATGEMGIGNTTTSSAVASVLLGAPVEEMTGRGAGLSSEGLRRKIDAIKTGIELHRPNPEDPVDVLAKVGGLDIAGMVGLFLGGALRHIPVLMDGFISCVAALIAIRLCPNADGYILASHLSKEPAARRLLDAMGKEAMIQAQMRMGEGTGAVAAFSLLDQAVTVYRTMSTFDDINLEQYEHLE